MKITQEYARECLNYDPETGIFRWKKRPIHHFPSTHSANQSNSHFEDKQAGSIDKIGYLVIVLSQKRHKAHRLAWLMINGNMPKSCIDHVNGVKTDNRFMNLREATVSQNSRNSKLRSSNSSGHKGVTWSNDRNKWIGRVMIDGKTHQKRFDHIEEASSWCKKMRTTHHSEFANHG